MADDQNVTPQAGQPAQAQDATQNQTQPVPDTQDQGLDDKSTTDQDQPQSQTQTPAQNPQPAQTQTNQQPDQQQQQNSQGQNPVKQPAVSTPAVTNPANHPAVQRASLLHTIAQTLAGGPRYTTSIDVNTGQLTRTQVPTSKSDIGMAIALEAIGGAATGLGVKPGPGNLGRAADAGYQEGKANAQQQQQQQTAEATANYARAAAITQTNFMTHRNAMLAGRMEKEDHDNYVANAKPVLDNIDAVGATIAKGVHESDLLSKYNVTKDVALPDGVIPRIDPKTGEQAKSPDGGLLWDNTYTVIDPNKKIELPEETANFLADHHVPGYFNIDKDGHTVPLNFSGSAQIKAGLVVSGVAAASAIKLTESAINSQLANIPNLPDNGAQDRVEFAANLTKSLQDSVVTPKQLQTIGRYAQLPLDQIAATMEKDKVDPGTVGAFRSLIPQEAIDASKAQRDAVAAKNKQSDSLQTIDTLNKAQTILADPKSYTPQQQAAASHFLHSDVATAAQKAGAEAAARTNAELYAKDKFDRSKTQQATLDAAQEAPVNGVRSNYLATLGANDPGHAALVKSVGEGTNLTAVQGINRPNMAPLLQEVMAAYPNFNQKDVINYYATTKDVARAKDVTAANTALEHLGDTFDAVKRAGVKAFIPGVAGAESAMGNKDVNDVQQGIARARTELEQAYKATGLTDQDAKHAVDTLKFRTPNEAEQSIKTATNLLRARYNAIDNKIARNMPSNAVGVTDVMSDEAHKAYKNIMGTDANVTQEQQRNTNQQWAGRNNVPVLKSQAPTPILSQSGNFIWDGKQWQPYTAPKAQPKQ